MSKPKSTNFMKKYLSKALLITSLANTLLIGNFTFADEVKKNSTTKTESRFYIQKGSQIKLCREVKQILDETENIDFGRPYLANSEFVIPTKYKNFSLPKWENISFEDFLKYISPDSDYLATLNTIDNTKKEALLTRITKFDLNHDGIDENVLGIKLKNEKMQRCYVSDLNKSQNDSSTYNKYSFDNCYLFYYDGRAFDIHRSFVDSLLIYEPISGNGIGFGMKQICAINMTKKSSSKALKALEEEVNKTATTTNSKN
jgi:hypothetical protein